MDRQDNGKESKKLRFVKAIRIIQNFESEKDTLSVFIKKLTGQSCWVTVGDYLMDELVSFLNYMMGIPDKDDRLGWWLYEDVKKVIYDGNTTIDVSTPELLFEYLYETYCKE